MAVVAHRELCSGERAVVLLFVFRVALSVPSSLFLHASALCLLSLAALFLEISVENSNSSLQRFKTRPGASSGILLGATTLPSVMLSRLIQVSRVLSVHQNGAEELAYLDMQYWTVSASCLGVLLFFLYLLATSRKRWCSPFSQCSRELSCTYVCILLYMVNCYFCFTLKTDGGWFGSKMLYLISYGAVTAILIQHILRKFPSCASIGEALLVSAGMVLYFGDMLAHTLAKLSMLFVPLKSSFISHGTHTEIATVIQGELLGLLLVPIFLKLTLQIWGYIRNTSTRPKIEMTALFYTSTIMVSVFLMPAWMNFVDDFGMHPLLWVLNFVFASPLERLVLCSYWICVICISVLRFYSISKQSKTERILLRKYYHLVAVLMFVPALIFQSSFLDLAFGTALMVFLLLEIIRVWQIWPLGKIVHQFMNAFTDHRDSEILIVSHFSLLLGCALPKWMSSGFNDRPLAPFAGILSLGIGDTMASMVGYKYGVLRWSKAGKKTVEGTAAGITSVWVACYILLPLLASSGYILSQHWGSLLIAVTLSGLLEAYTAQLDNAFIPLVFYSLLCL
ncbi:Dolichol kinase [Rhynchospora pubera]|uniref:dolichol kinase n=1 Tax=Rhynchospora pubera TaxID=906938 RepID=A0AAV8EX64_9POAL|nr:Dolichol kinase [Rhynchospora pubera]